MKAIGNVRTDRLRDIAAQVKSAAEDSRYALGNIVAWIAEDGTVYTSHTATKAGELFVRCPSRLVGRYRRLSDVDGIEADLADVARGLE